MRKYIALLLLVIPLFACSQTPDEDLIRDNLDQVISAVKERQPKQVVNHLTEDFLAQERMGIQEVRRFMIAQFFRNQQINIVLTGLKVNVEGSYATASFRVVITGGVNWLPDRLDYYEVETTWLKRKGDWRINSADWQPVMAA